jgi:hypothetical protein
MKQQTMRIGLLVSLSAILAFGFIAVSMQNVVAQTVLQGYPTSGRTSATVSTALTKTINMHGFNALSLVLQASGGNFGSKFMLVSVSVDNTNFIQIDNVSLSTNTISVKQYDSAHLGTGVAINPALFPFVKVAQSAGNSGVTPTLTWSASH